MENVAQMIAENGKLAIAVLLAAVAGIVLLLVRTRMETPTIWWYLGRPPRNLTEHQKRWVMAAKLHWGRIGWEMKRKTPNMKVVRQEAEDCLWCVIFSHFRADNGLYSGYCFDLSIPEAIERAYRLTEAVLVPELIEIAERKDPRGKALLVCRYMYLLMAGVFDENGGDIRYDILREVTEADYHTDRQLVADNRGAFLHRLGFRFRTTSVGTVWYWPQRTWRSA